VFHRLDPALGFHTLLALAIAFLFGLTASPSWPAPSSITVDVRADLHRLGLARIVPDRSEVSAPRLEGKT